MNFEDYLSNEKTIYSIVGEDGEKSTITIEKWAADLLQDMLPDVHQWMQQQYNMVCQRKPKTTRRNKGNIVRLLARSKAEKNSNFIPMIDFL